MDEEKDKPRVILQSEQHRVTWVPNHGALKIEQRDEAAMGETQWKHLGQFYLNPGACNDPAVNRLHAIGQVITALLIDGTVREHEYLDQVADLTDVVQNLRENLDMHSEQALQAEKLYTTVTREYARFMSRVREWDADLVDSIMAEFKIEDDPF